MKNYVQGLGRLVQQVWYRQPVLVSGMPIHTAATRLCNADDYSTHQVERLEKTLNQVMLLGRVGGPPEKRGSEEHPVVTFSLATHTNYRKGGDLIQQTEWHRIAVFKPYLRESVYRYMRRGQRVMVHGKIGYLERRDEESNQLVMKTATIIANDVIFFTKGDEQRYNTNTSE
ncbi:hypothetical protein Pmani_022035 [Petrolisthes manimaculis]|uniref:Single-stranded DNA-binding protein, mitochondrial n=1 Tax=Petrolisthes manimaculis TaxID=1843537 RepID=A0AAE1PCV7_9EUCA|nr:hypothetical protein Pmani_022035 [Petrolisthes manimaculis]